MTETTKPAPADIRAFRAENPKMRERDIAAQLQISEAALVAAEVGISATRIDGSASKLLERVAELGEVMALFPQRKRRPREDRRLREHRPSASTPRSCSAKTSTCAFSPSRWAHGFAVTKKDGDQERLSLQYFDKAGNAVHKVHLRPNSNVEAYHAIVARSEARGSVAGIRRRADSLVRCDESGERQRARSCASTGAS